MMRFALALLLIGSTVAALAVASGGAGADDAALAAPAAQAMPANDTCLAAADLREAVGDGRVIEPVAAIRAARRVIPRAEIQRARLCRHEDGLVYVLTALRRDGHFVHVMVDAKSGALVGQ